MNQDKLKAFNVFADPIAVMWSLMRMDMGSGADFRWWD